MEISKVWLAVSFVDAAAVILEMGRDGRGVSVEEAEPRDQSTEPWRVLPNVGVP